MAKKRRVIVIEEDDEGGPDEGDLEGGRMPFLQHLVELRTRLRNAAIAFIGAFLVCWYYSSQIFDWLRKPLFDIWLHHCEQSAATPQCLAHHLKSIDNWGPPKLIYTGLTQPFWVDMSIGMWAGIFVASPFIFFQLWRFIAPGLYKKERRIAVSFAVISAVCFAVGALFCYYVALPQLYQFLLSYNTRDVQSLPNIQDYLDLTRASMLGFGVVFELPLILYFMGLVGLVTHRRLWKFGRYWVVLAFSIGAVLTPGPDVVSQFLMSMPLVLLYFIGIIPVWLVTRRREKKAELERLRNLADEQHPE